MARIPRVFISSCKSPVFKFFVVSDHIVLRHSRYFGGLGKSCHGSLPWLLTAGCGWNSTLILVLVLPLPLSVSRGLERISSALLIFIYRFQLV